MMSKYFSPFSIKFSTQETIHPSYSDPDKDALMKWYNETFNQHIGNFDYNPYTRRIQVTPETSIFDGDDYE